LQQYQIYRGSKGKNKHLFAAAMTQVKAVAALENFTNITY
jgi:hypothetical protein